MDYTIFSLGCNNEVLCDHLLVSWENLAAAIDELVEYWETQQSRPRATLTTRLSSAFTAKSTRVRCATARVGSRCRGSRVGQ